MEQSYSSLGNLLSNSKEDEYFRATMLVGSIFLKYPWLGQIAKMIREMIYVIMPIT